MGPVGEVALAWRGPGRAVARLRHHGEGAALARLLAGCAAAFISTWPALGRASMAGPPPFEARVAGALFAWMFMAPLMFYALAALSHLAARAFGGRGDWRGARLALFGALFWAAPVTLLHGAIAGLAPDTVLQPIAAGVLAGGFLYIWLVGLVAVESPTRVAGP